MQFLVIKGPPGATPEAYFAALVVYIDGPKLPANLQKIPARYFTLERGTPIDGGTRTVLCEWTETTHSNFGDGPDPTVDAFVRALPRSF